ncbi:MAG: hypothetical protein PVG89_06630 [Gammaproteobacteria bacterium]|jgi:hypothetical protein
MMKRQQSRVLQILLLLILLLNLAPLQSIAAAKTDAEIRNYTAHELTIEFKKVDLKGHVNWVPIGTISSKSSRVIRNLTIGSVLRAKHGNTVIDKQKVDSPSRDAKYTVINIRE